MQVNRCAEVVQRIATDRQTEVLNSVRDLQAYAEEIRQRKAFVRKQGEREEHQRRLMTELVGKMDQPALNGGEGEGRRIGKPRKRHQSNPRGKIPKENSLLDQAKDRMLHSKNRLSQELAKALEKKDID